MPPSVKEESSIASYLQQQMQALKTPERIGRLDSAKRWQKFHAQNILPNRKPTFLSNGLNGE